MGAGTFKHKIANIVLLTFHVVILLMLFGMCVYVIAFHGVMTLIMAAIALALIIGIWGALLWAVFNY
jgi:hypothetical protein